MLSLRNPFARTTKSARKAEGKAAPSRRTLMQLRPVRNPALTWEEQEGVVLLRIANRNTPNADSWKARLARVFVQLPEERVVELDSLGTDVWKMLDGENTVSSIVAALAKKHHLSRRETELSVQQYFKELARRNYIAFVADETK